MSYGKNKIIKFILFLYNQLINSVDCAYYYIIK